jgi:16S rRNA (cytidine1402-2'-O)-methyltransferase
MTFRSVKILKEVNIIASEDTRNTKKLLNHFDISTKQISLHEHNVAERVPELIEMLKEGQTIAQVSDAGMPSISDPGHELVVKAISEDIDVISLPGASAGITALIAPRKNNEQKNALQTLKNMESALIFYESPHRIAKTLANMKEVFGETRQAVLCRELTKLYEEYTRGTIESLLEFFEEQTIKGECCLIIEGFDPSQETNSLEENLTPMEHVNLLINEMGFTSKEAIKEVAKIRGLKKQVVYKEFHGE